VATFVAMNFLSFDLALNVPPSKVHMTGCDSANRKKENHLIVEQFERKCPIVMLPAAAIRVVKKVRHFVSFVLKMNLSENGVLHR
jgi:hypothetical protein